MKLTLHDRPVQTPRRGRWLEFALLLCGLAGVDAYIWTNVNTVVGQAYDSWSLDRQIKGQQSSLRGFIAEELGIPALAPAEPPAQPRPREAVNRPLPPPAPSSPAVQPAPRVARRLATFALIGRVEVPRLHLNAVVREGVDDATLRRAVGHMPSTALPGNPGNVAFAAHRDTLFRKLRDVRKDDKITVQATDGNTYDYVVDSLKIVKPSDVSVLEPTPGEQSLTLITCYPFNYIGAAPDRFIVRARQVNVTAKSSQPPRSQTGS